MKVRENCLEEIQVHQIAVPLEPEYLARLRALKRSGRTIGHYVREALVEKFQREDRARLRVVGGE